MNILVIFPKEQCYTLKSLSLQRRYRERFIQYIKLLSEHGCRLEILLEDQLAYDMLNACGIIPYKVSTCLSKADIAWIEKYPDIDGFSSRVFMDYPVANLVSYPECSKFTTPLSALKEGKSVYYKKRVEEYRKRYSYTINRYISDCTNIMQFRVNGPMDRGCPVKTTVHQGDGRLCIEVGMDNGSVASYYGGVFIPEESLPTILSL